MEQKSEIIDSKQQGNVTFVKVKDSEIKEPFSNSKNRRGDKIFDSEESNSPQDAK